MDHNLQGMLVEQGDELMEAVWFKISSHILELKACRFVFNSGHFLHNVASLDSRRLVHDTCHRATMAGANIEF